MVSSANNDVSGVGGGAVMSVESLLNSPEGSQC